MLSTSDFDVDVTRLKKLMNFEINKSSENGVTIVNIKPKLESIVLKRCQESTSRIDLSFPKLDSDSSDLSSVIVNSGHKSRQNSISWYRSRIVLSLGKVQYRE